MTEYEPSDYPLEPKYVVQPMNFDDVPSYKQKSSNDKSVFEPLNIIKITDTRSIAVSKLSDEKLWFNERLDKKNFSGFTRKGFGLPTKHFISFREALRKAVTDETSISEFNITDKIKLIISHPTVNTIDIRQFEHSEKYTGFQQKGLRMLTDNAVKFLDGLDDIVIK